MVSLDVMLKGLAKKTIPRIPGYHLACLALRRWRTDERQWIDRLPIAPGMKVLVHSPAGDLLMTRPERCSIAKKFFWTGGVRKPEEDRLALDLFAKLARTSAVALDIGANSGLFSIVAAKSNRSIEVVAFDILPEAYHTLIDNLIINGLLDRVEVRLAGVGIAGTRFEAPFDNISSEMPTSLSLDVHSKGASVNVRVLSLDEICIPRFAGRRICIKIDVEGTEIDIFEGGTKTLAGDCEILCEVLTRATRFEQYDELLSQLAYRKFLITDEGLKRFDRITPHPRFKDWLFTKA